MAKAGVERWLAAILPVDVAEYGHLMGVGTEGTGWEKNQHGEYSSLELDRQRSG